MSFKKYAANRIDQIQQITEREKFTWNWVKGGDNPADIISRGASISELKKLTKWWKGPDWLFEIEKEWPVQPSISDGVNMSEMYKEEIDRELKYTLKKS